MAMKRALATVALALVVLTTSSVASAFHRHPRWNCGWHGRKTVWARKQIIKCWAGKRGLPRLKPVRVARCESGPDLLDDYIADGHGGTFQHVVAYWPGRAAAYGAKGYGIRGVWAQARVSTGMARDTGGWAAHWPTCGKAA